MTAPEPSAAPNPPRPGRLAWFAVWRWKRRWVATLLASVPFIGYPLSIGPAVLLVGTNLCDGTTAARAYRPLLYARAKCDMLRRPLDEYMRLWSSNGRSEVIYLHSKWEYGPTWKPPAKPRIPVPFGD